MSPGPEGDSGPEAVVALVVQGRDLTAEDLEIINKHRKLEFDSQSEINPKPDGEDWDKPYFLVREAGELVAFGRLHSVKVQFQGQVYEVLGIATIVAIKKGLGYGKILMEEIKQYVENSGKTAIGFCDPEMSEFYEKCGYSILRSDAQRFKYANREDDASTMPPADTNKVDDVIYIDGEDHLLEAMLGRPKECATTSRPRW